MSSYNTIEKTVISKNTTVILILNQNVAMNNNHCYNGVYKIKEKLYYLEEVLPSKDFIRISNSAIININHVKCFNTSIIGKIIVKFKDGSKESVSKRRTSEIMRFLKNRSE